MKTYRNRGMALPRHQQKSSRNAGGRQWLTPRTLFLSFSLILSIVGADDVQCPDGQVFIEVSGIDPSSFVTRSKLDISVSSPGYDEDYFEYNAAYDAELQQFETFCVPADKCLMVKVETESLAYSASQISIIYDAVPYSLLGPFPPNGEYNAFYVELGESCNVTCDANQVLLEIEAVTDSRRSGMDLPNHFDWQVMDDSNEVIGACPPPAGQPNNTIGSVTNDIDRCYWVMDGLFRDRVCVPKDGCYRLVAGQSAHGFQTIFEVTFGGEKLLRTEHFQFERLLLQHSESPSTCSLNGPCQSEDADPSKAQVEMEIFLFRNELYYEEGQNLTWNADYISSGQLVSETGIVFPGDRPLLYDRICIPGCTLFSVTAGTYGAYAYSYQVQIDDIIYAEDSYRPVGFEWGTSVSDVIGSSCQASQVCGQGQSLVQVDVRYGSELPDNLDPTGDSSMWDGWSIFAAPTEKAKKNYMDNPEPAQHLYGVSGFPVRLPGKHYRKQICLDGWYFQDGSDTRCTALEIKRGESHIMESSSVSVDGKVIRENIDCSQEVPLAYRRMCSWAYVEESSSLSVQLTPLNGNCKVKGIPGIISSATVGGVLLIAGLCYCLKRYRVAASKNSNDPSAPPPGDRNDAAHAPYPAAAMREPVAIPLDVTKPSRSPVVPQVSNGNNPQTMIGIESSQVPTSTPQAHTVTVSDEEDFA